MVLSGSNLFFTVSSSNEQNEFPACKAYWQGSAGEKMMKKEDKRKKMGLYLLVIKCRIFMKSFIVE